METFININVYDIFEKVARINFTHLYTRKMEETKETILFNNIVFYKLNNFSDYFISKCGKILSLKSKTNFKLLKLWEANGYKVITFRINNKNKVQYIHRLLGELFILNINNKKCINHKDGNKLNNNLSNLEWVSHSENNSHAFKLNLKKHNIKGKFGILHPYSKKISQCDLNNNLIKIWDSMADIEKELKFYKGNICLCCKNKRKSAYNYFWRYYYE